MKGFKSILILIFCLLTSTIIAQSNGKEILEAEKRKKEEQQRKFTEKIKLTNDLINKNKTKLGGIKSTLKLTNSKIQRRNNQILTLQSEYKELEAVINRKSRIISALEKDFEILKKEYEKLIIDAYKNHNSQNRLLFLFQSEDFNQLVARLRYLRHYTTYREKQADAIIETKSHIAKKVAELNSIKDEKIKILNQENIQKQKLKLEKEEYNNYYNKVKSKIKNLNKDLQEYKRKKQQLAKEIEKIIKEIIDLEKNIDIKLSKAFAENKAKLPWPVRGVITGKYGKHKHPIYDIWMENNGVDITCEKGSEIRVAFNGKVVEVLFSAAFQKAIVVNHGKYFSVYSNLKQVYIEKGDQLKTGDPIGVVHTDGEGTTELHFEIWEGENTLNPEKWLIK